MASGCIPRKTSRKAAFAGALDKLQRATAILAAIGDDPDHRPDVIMQATSLVVESLGQRAGDFIDTDKPLGLADLVEHYFS